LKGNENAAALLLRVFLELSTEAYLMEKAASLPHSATKQGKTKWDDFGISLATKISCAADHLDPTKKAKEFQQARLAVDPSNNTPGSVTTLHGYFHNQKLKPDVDLVRTAWDAWETYLREIHKAR
jgi:hypothetical protein